MPLLVPLVVALSLDVTRGLVAAGAGLGFDGRRYTVTGAPGPLAVVDATNTSPIVITVDKPHTIPFAATNVLERQMHAVVSGVLGNAAANNIDAAATSFTIGSPLGTICVAISETQFALYAGYDYTGALVPLAGDGVYTGGGTVVPAFTRGRILMGREFLREATTGNAPPACIFVPVGSRWGGRSVSLPAPAGPQRAVQLALRPLATEAALMEIYSWGQVYPPDAALDFDRTQQIYHQVVASTHLIAGGRFEIVVGDWDDQREKATQYLKAGHLHVMRIAYGTPVLDAPRAFVPTDTAFDPATYMSLDGGPPEKGCGG